MAWLAAFVLRMYPAKDASRTAKCRKRLYAEKIKARAFAEYARRFGLEKLLDCLECNEQAGIVYHREGIMGDYDEFDDLEELIECVRTGKRSSQE